MKKNLYIIMIIVLFISFSNTVKAACGDLIYEMTNITVTDNGQGGAKIAFEGWAFIHFTNNSKEAKTYTNGGPYGGGQEIMIVATTSSGKKIYLKNLLYDDESITTSDPKLKAYNFYYTLFYDKGNGNVGGEYTNNYNHLTGRYDANSCKGVNADGSETTQCLYEDIGFHIEFDTSSLNITSDEEVEFLLYATNNDFTNKYGANCNGTKDRKGKVDAIGYDRRNWAGSQIYYYDGVLKNRSTSKIDITSESSSKDKVYVTVHDGMPRLNDGNSWTLAGGYGNYIKNDTYDLYGAKRTEAGNCGQYNCGPGDYIIRTSSTGLQPGNTNFARIYRSWAVPAGKTTLKIKVKSDKKCTIPPASPKKDMKCNNWTNLSSTCKELTVINGDARANVTITQKGYIANVFKSNLVNTDQNYNASSYNGGWFKYGITYYNEVSWEFINGDALSQDVKAAITKEMENRLNDLTIFKSNLVLNIEGLNDTKPITKCTESGSFTSGNKLITTCTFFLPSSEINNNLSGKVTYSQSDTTAGINNRYYIPTSESNHKIDATLSGLSRLNVDQANTDSALAKKGNKKSWLGDWSISTTCSLQVKDRLTNTPSTDGSGTNTEKVKYKFIYRPINLSNPFPNRYPGINWYDWYITENNKDKKTLEESYSKLDYYVNLDNKTISEIKKYNQNKTYFGEVEKEFFNQYIKEGGS